MCVCIYGVRSDVQSVSTTVVDESTTQIQCWFIHGSDADTAFKYWANLSRNNNVIVSVSGKLNPIHNMHFLLSSNACIHFDIDINNSISNLTIEGMIKLMTRNKPAGILL